MSFDLKRRGILKVGAATLLTGATGAFLIDRKKAEKSNKTNPELILLEHESAVRDNLQKVKNFAQTFSEDVFLTIDKQAVFQTTLKSF